MVLPFFPRSFRWVTALALVPLVSLMPVSAAAQSKASVKVAIIYNVLRFVSFPGSQANLTLCARRSEEIARNLEGLQGRQVSGRTLAVRIVSGFDEMDGRCDVIYAGSASARSLPAGGRGRITIGEHSEFIDQGGTVGLVSFGSQVRFTINSRAAQNANVRFSSQLMQLAARVIT